MQNIPLPVKRNLQDSVLQFYGTIEEGYMLSASLESLRKTFTIERFSIMHSSLLFSLLSTINLTISFFVVYLINNSNFQRGYMQISPFPTSLFFWDDTIFSCTFD